MTSPFTGIIIVSSYHFNSHITTIKFTFRNSNIRKQCSPSKSIRSTDTDSHSINQIRSNGTSVPSTTNRLILICYIMKVAIFNPYIFVVIRVFLPNHYSSITVGNFQTFYFISGIIHNPYSINSIMSGLYMRPCPFPIRRDNNRIFRPATPYRKQRLFQPYITRPQ